MKQHNLELFNEVYDSKEMYYGWELREEFTDFVKGINLIEKTVLDLGCGEGRYSIFLAEQGCNVVAVDASAVAINKLKNIAGEKGLNINPIEAHLESYAIAQNAFDIVIAATILDHLADKLRLITVAGIIDSLRVGGIVYVNVFTTSDPGYEVRIRKSNRQDISDTAMCIEHYFEPKELFNLFSKLQTIYYHEGIELDLSHGTPHNHGWASLIAHK